MDQSLLVVLVHTLNVLILTPVTTLSILKGLEVTLLVLVEVAHSLFDLRHLIEYTVVELAALGPPVLLTPLFLEHTGRVLQGVVLDGVLDGPQVDDVLYVLFVVVVAVEAFEVLFVLLEGPRLQLPPLVLLAEGLEVFVLSDLELVVVLDLHLEHP